MTDAWLVARFEVLRAVRTWRAMALMVLFCVASGGAAYMFVHVVGLMESEPAQQMAVPTTATPGAMLEELVESRMYRNMVTEMIGAPELVDHLVSIPPLALFNLWFGFLLVPFFAASASAECIALDVQQRSIRYELLRTGRLEIVAGRMMGQLLLTGGALAAATAVVWVVGVSFMVISDPLELGGWLAWLGLRAGWFAVPFVGLGVAASQLTASPAWARVLAVGATAGTWILYGAVRHWESQERLLWLVDALLQILPQGWLRGMWGPGGDWVWAAAAVTAIGTAFAASGFVVFARKDV